MVLSETSAGASRDSPSYTKWLTPVIAFLFMMGVISLIVYIYKFGWFSMPHVELSVGLRVHVPVGADALISDSAQGVLQERLSAAVLSYIREAADTTDVRVHDVRCRFIPTGGFETEEFDMLEYLAEVTVDYTYCSRAELRALDLTSRVMETTGPQRTNMAPRLAQHIDDMGVIGAKVYQARLMHKATTIRKNEERVELRRKRAHAPQKRVAEKQFGGEVGGEYEEPARIEAQWLESGHGSDPPSRAASMYGVAQAAQAERSHSGDYAYDDDLEGYVDYVPRYAREGSRGNALVRYAGNQRRFS